MAASLEIDARRPSCYIRVVAEKRKYRRLPVKALPCRVYQDGQLVDLSIGGAFVATEHPLPSGCLRYRSLKCIVFGKAKALAYLLCSQPGEPQRRADAKK